MTVHIGANEGDYAPLCLLPGDPLRAKWVAENFLSKVKTVNQVRGMLGFTGEYQGHPVSVQGTGMGRPSISIYVNELIKSFNVQTLIRIGSSGAIADHLKLHDIVIALAASYPNNMNRSWLGDVNFSPCPDFELIASAQMEARKRQKRVFVGGIYSGDLFYEANLDQYDRLKSHGVLSVDMETSELYTLANRFGRKAMSLLTISDHIYSGEELTSKEREQGLADMVEIAINSALNNAI